MSEKEIDIQQILVHFRELVGQQAQEIAILRATIDTLEQPKDKVE